MGASVKENPLGVPLLLCGLLEGTHTLAGVAVSKAGMWAVGRPVTGHWQRDVCALLSGGMCVPSPALPVGTGLEVTSPALPHGASLITQRIRPHLGFVSAS